MPSYAFKGQCYPSADYAYASFVRSFPTMYQGGSISLHSHSLDGNKVNYIQLVSAAQAGASPYEYYQSASMVLAPCDMTITDVKLADYWIVPAALLFYFIGLKLGLTR